MTLGPLDRDAVVARIVEESGWTPRYAFMTLMSAGIAVLGLLLSSPAVVIGAMLISPLMNPIMGLGFSLAIFDFVELRRSLIALVIGSVLAVLFTALVVLASPLKAPTAEILSRTRPTLFDLLVALFAALAGAFAIIRGKGETITGVAIATALMPPLAVVGYGLATWNLPVLRGSLALFTTNFVTIALAAMVMARIYGFGHKLSARQTWAQTVVLVLAFALMAVPLGVSLVHIAGEAVTVSKVRSILSERFGSRSRVTQLDVDFTARLLSVRSVVIAPRSEAAKPGELKALLEKRLGRPVAVQVDQVLLDARASALQTQEAELQQAKAAQSGGDDGARVAALVGLAAGVDPDGVTLDRDHRRAVAAFARLGEADLQTYRALAERVAAAAPGWTITLTPPRLPLPEIAFGDNQDALDEAARAAVVTSAWAARSWNDPALAVPGLPEGPPSARPSLAQRRALAVAAVLKAQGVAATPAPAAGQRFRLSESVGPA